MSNEAQTWARSQEIGNTLQKFTLIELANYADDQWSCFPSNGLLARTIEVDERSIRRAIRALEATGWICTKKRERASRADSSNRYYLNAPQAPHIAFDLDLELESPEVVSERPKPRKRSSAPARPEGDTGSGGGGQGVRGEGDTGSAYEGDTGSPLSIHQDVIPQSIEGQTDGNSSPTEEKTKPKNSPSGEALSLIADDLEWGRHKRPSKQQAHELAALVDDALAGGLTMVELRRHCVSSLNEAKQAGVSYLRGALSDKHLPMPRRQKVPAKPAESVPETTGAPQAPQAPGEANQRARAEIEATRKKLAEVNAQRRAERQRELSPAAA